MAVARALQAASTALRRNPIVVGIVIAAGMMSAGPVAAQSLLDKARDKDKPGPQLKVELPGKARDKGKPGPQLKVVADSSKVKDRRGRRHREQIHNL